jgi:hypothetical protein
VSFIIVFSSWNELWWLPAAEGNHIEIQNKNPDESDYINPIRADLEIVSSNFQE